MNYIGYCRVSTEKQNQTGLGLESQKDSIESYVKTLGGELLNIYQDVESGSKTDRTGLQLAIFHALKSNSTLLVKKLDRLSRDGFKITTQLEDLGVTFLDVDSPHDTGLLKNIKMALAKDEREKIAERTQAAMHVIKNKIDSQGFYITKKGKRIKSLGHTETLGGNLAIERSIATRKKKAQQDPANVKATGIAVMMYQDGKTLTSIKNFLNTNNFKTSRGNEFSVAQVSNLLQRAGHHKVRRSMVKQ